MFLEQPLPPHDLAGLKALASSRLPIGVDEGIHAPCDIKAHAHAAARGVSLTADQVGGLLRRSTPPSSASALRSRSMSRQDRGIEPRQRGAIHLACAVPAIGWGVSPDDFYLAHDLGGSRCRARRTCRAARTVRAWVRSTRRQSNGFGCV